MREWITTECRNRPSTTNPEDVEIVDAPGNDGNASMPEQVKRPNPWRRRKKKKKKKKKMMMMMMQETSVLNQSHLTVYLFLDWNAIYEICRKPALSKKC